VKGEVQHALITIALQSQFSVVMCREDTDEDEDEIEYENHKN
jgi:hypothetical protein